MKFMIVFVALFAVALAAPTADSAAEVVRSEAVVGVDGFNYAYQTSNGISENAQAVLKNVGSEQEGISVSGSYSFYADDGQLYTVNYIADENGFQPQGAHLPVAPLA